MKYTTSIHSTQSIKHTYYSQGQWDELKCFIELFTGIIKLRRSPPPKLRGPQYVLNVTATDDNAAGGPLPLSSSAQVIVGINDINNNKPVFDEVRLSKILKLCQNLFLTKDI